MAGILSQSSGKKVDKALLKNVVKHADTSNRMKEEKVMWKQYEREKEKESQREDRSSWGQIGSLYSDTIDNGPTKSTPVVGVWTKQLMQMEEKDPERWGHSGFKELYPEEFKDDERESSDPPEVASKIEKVADKTERMRPDIPKEEATKGNQSKGTNEGAADEKSPIPEDSQNQNMDISPERTTSAATTAEKQAGGKDGKAKLSTILGSLKFYDSRRLNRRPGFKERANLRVRKRSNSSSRSRSSSGYRRRSRSDSRRRSRSGHKSRSRRDRRRYSRGRSRSRSWSPPPHPGGYKRPRSWTRSTSGSRRRSRSWRSSRSRHRSRSRRRSFSSSRERSWSRRRSGSRRRSRRSVRSDSSSRSSSSSHSRGRAKRRSKSTSTSRSRSRSPYKSRGNSKEESAAITSKEKPTESKVEKGSGKGENGHYDSINGGHSKNPAPADKRPDVDVEMKSTGDPQLEDDTELKNKLKAQIIAMEKQLANANAPNSQKYSDGAAEGEVHEGGIGPKCLLKVEGRETLTSTACVLDPERKYDDKANKDISREGSTGASCKKLLGSENVHSVNEVKKSHRPNSSDSSSENESERKQKSGRKGKKGRKVKQKKREIEKRRKERAESSDSDDSDKSTSDSSSTSERSSGSSSSRDSRGSLKHKSKSRLVPSGKSKNEKAETMKEHRRSNSLDRSVPNVLLKKEEMASSDDHDVADCFLPTAVNSSYIPDRESVLLEGKLSYTQKLVNNIKSKSSSSEEPKGSKEGETNDSKLADSEEGTAGRRIKKQVDDNRAADDRWSPGSDVDAWAELSDAYAEEQPDVSKHEKKTKNESLQKDEIEPGQPGTDTGDSDHPSKEKRGLLGSLEVATLSADQSGIIEGDEAKTFVTQQNELPIAGVNKSKTLHSFEDSEEDNFQVLTPHSLQRHKPKKKKSERRRSKRASMTLEVDVLDWPKIQPFEGKDFRAEDKQEIVEPDDITVEPKEQNHALVPERFQDIGTSAMQALPLHEVNEDMWQGDRGKEVYVPSDKEVDEKLKSRKKRKSAKKKARRLQADLPEDKFEYLEKRPLDIREFKEETVDVVGKSGEKKAKKAKLKRPKQKWVLRDYSSDYSSDEDDLEEDEENVSDVNSDENYYNDDEKEQVHPKKQRSEYKDDEDFDIEEYKKERKRLKKKAAKAGKLRKGKAKYVEEKKSKKRLTKVKGGVDIVKRKHLKRERAGHDEERMLDAEVDENILRHYRKRKSKKKQERQQKIKKPRMEYVELPSSDVSYESDEYVERVKKRKLSKRRKETEISDSEESDSEESEKSSTSEESETSISYQEVSKAKYKKRMKKKLSDVCSSEEEELEDDVEKYRVPKKEKHRQLKRSQLKQFAMSDDLALVDKKRAKKAAQHYKDARARKQLINKKKRKRLVEVSLSEDSSEISYSDSETSSEESVKMVSSKAKKRELVQEGTSRSESCTSDSEDDLTDFSSDLRPGRRLTKDVIDKSSRSNLIRTDKSTKRSKKKKVKGKKKKKRGRLAH